MRTLRRRIVLVLAAVVGIATRGGAQPTSSNSVASNYSAPTESVTWDFTLGVNTGASNARRYNTDGSISFTTLIGMRPARSAPFVYAISAQGRAQWSDLCLLASRVESRCLPSLPTMAFFGVLAGASRTGESFGQRLLLGPALVRSEGQFRLSAQAHADLSLGSTHGALVFAMRGSLVPWTHGEVIRLLSYELGLRSR